MPSSDFYECWAYECLEPFGGRRGDLQAGIIASAIFNSQRTSKTTKAFKPHEFMPEWDKQEPLRPPQTAEQVLNAMLALQRAQAARLG